MDGGLRVDVAEGDAVVVFVDDGGWDLFVYDLVEDGGGITGGGTLVID